jgi:tetratricopeptide (TPR) repeat protein
MSILNESYKKVQSGSGQVIGIVGEVAPELKSLVLTRASGNPLYMEEFTYSLLENGTIGRQDGKYIVNADISDAQIPETIQGIIAARMDRLENNLKQTIQVASVIGRDFAYTILHSITGMKEELKSSLLNLQGLEFIHEKQLFPELEYIFKHALIQEVAYDSLLIARRKEIHQKIGEAIEQLHSERLEEYSGILAYHFHKAEDQEKAYDYYIHAGDRAAGKYSNEEAINSYHQARSIIEQFSATQEVKIKKISLYTSITNLYFIRGMPDQMLEVLQTGEKLAKELNDEKSILFFANYINTYHLARGNVELGLSHIEESCKELLKTKQLDSLVPLSINLGFAYQVSCEDKKMIRIIPKVIQLIEKQNRQFDSFDFLTCAYSFLCVFASVSFAELGCFNEATSCVEKAIQVADKVGDTFALGLAETAIGKLLINKGDGKEALIHFEKSSEYSEKSNEKSISSTIWGLKGRAYYLLGDYANAFLYFNKGFDLKNESAISASFLSHSRILCLAYFDSGNIDKAYEYAESTLAMAIKKNTKADIGKSKIAFGRVLGVKYPDRLEEAFNYLNTGIRLLIDLENQPDYSLGYYFLGELYAHNNQNDKALEHLEMAEKMFKKLDMGYWMGRIQVILSQYHQHQKNIPEAREFLTKAINIMKELEAYGWVERYEKQLAEMS